jgi:RimJ/RimL family protein N-acetyltransferase
MNITRYTDCKLFLHDVETFLLNDEYMNNLMLGLLYRILKSPSNPKDVLLKITAQDQMIVLMMSGLYLIIYANTKDHDLYLNTIHYLKDNKIEYPGIIGPNFYCEAFVKAYNELDTHPLKLGMSQRIFVNKKVNHISYMNAKLILAQNKHMHFLVDWMYDFLNDTLEQPTTLSATSKIESMIESQSLYLLEFDNQIVSMAGAIRPFRKGISVGYVYTPVNYRNKGFATKCVELLTDQLLKMHDYCTLYTDLANPTSNSIYQKIGYVPIGDSVVYIK